MQMFRWNAAIPLATNPLNGAANSCDVNQSGPVFFLGGAYETSTLTRTCTISEGQSIFFPVINMYYTNVDESPPKTEAELHTLASFWAGAITSFSAEIDGQTVENLEEYRFHTEMFSVGFGAGSPLSTANTPSGETELVAEGIYLLLTPLPPGPHTIRFRGLAEYTTAEFGFDGSFALDITYRLTIAPR